MRLGGRFVDRVAERSLERQREVYLQKLAETHDAYQVKLEKVRAEAEAARRSARGFRRAMNEYRAYERAIRLLPRHDYGSLTPGVPEWHQKWIDSPGKRVVLFSKRDYSGSFYKWASAINAHTDWAARLVTFHAHEYGYPVDLLLPNPAHMDSDWDTLFSEADLIHLKDETGFMDGSNRLEPDFLTRRGLPIVFTQYGGYARKHREDDKYAQFVSQFPAVVSMTPDLCFPWIKDPIYIPHSVDTAAFPYEWTDGPVIGHSPSTRGRKGTEDFEEALGRLATDDVIKLELIEGVTHDECLERKRHTNIFFDQAGREVKQWLGTSAVIGWYGNSALESAVHGIPTIAHLSDTAFDGAARAGRDIRDQCAIINTDLGVDGIEATLGRLLSMGADERQQVSLDTRAWVEDFHSQEAVAVELQSLYNRVAGVHVAA